MSKMPKVSSNKVISATGKNPMQHLMWVLPRANEASRLLPGRYECRLLVAPSIGVEAEETGFVTSMLNKPAYYLLTYEGHHGY